MSRAAETAIRTLAAACLATSGYVHAWLYGNGYRAIPNIGTSFRWQAAASLAVAVLLPLTNLVLLRLAAAGLAAGSLGGFFLSRTVGVLGFTEHGWVPAPQALISVLVEVTALLALAVPVVGWLLPRVRRVRTAMAGTSSDQGRNSGGTGGSTDPATNVSGSLSG